MGEYTSDDFALMILVKATAKDEHDYVAFTILNSADGLSGLEETFVASSGSYNYSS